MKEDLRSAQGGHGFVGSTRGNERRRQSSDPLVVAVRHIVDTLPYSLFVVSHDGTVLWQNSPARRLCGEPAKIFRLVKHRLLIQGRLVGEWFDTSVRRGPDDLRVLRHSAGGARAEYWMVFSRPNLRRTCDPVVVAVYERHRTRSVAERLLRQLYDLTPSEAAIAAHLFRGLRPRQVAEAVGSSVHTVRSHAKRVFTKCHVSSQSELVRLLAFGPGIE